MAQGRHREIVEPPTLPTKVPTAYATDSTMVTHMRLHPEIGQGSESKLSDPFEIDIGPSKIVVDQYLNHFLDPNRVHKEGSPPIDFHEPDRGFMFKNSIRIT